MSKSYQKEHRDNITDEQSSVKWGLLTRSRSGVFKILTTLKTIKNH